MSYFKTTIELLVNADSESEACDLISEALTHNLKANGVINDWQYAKDNDTYVYPTEITEEEAENKFAEIQK